MSRMLVVCSLLVIFTATARSDEKAELKKLNGKWTPVKANLGEQDISEALKNLELVIKDGKYSAVTDELTDSGKFTIHTEISPLGMDIESEKGPNAGEVILAIYKFTGKELVVSYAINGDARPKEFKPQQEPLRLLITYKKSED